MTTRSLILAFAVSLLLVGGAACGSSDFDHHNDEPIVLSKTTREQMTQRTGLGSVLSTETRYIVVYENQRVRAAMGIRLATDGRDF
jgi:hypothetical protein